MIDDFDKLSVTELRQRGMTSDKIVAEQKRRGMTKQQIHDAWFPEPPTFNRIWSRRSRRRLVLATYGGWLLVAVILLVSSTLYPESLLAAEVMPLTGLAGFAVIGVWFFRKTYISRAVLASDAGLDERLVQNRNLAFRRAFQIFVPLVMLAWPLSAAIIAAEPGRQGYIGAWMLYLAAVILGPTLPTTIWAWREPDPVEPEKLPA